MKQITTTLLLLVAAASLSHGDQPPAAAPKAKAPAGAQAIAPDGKMKMVEPQAQDVAVARNHTLLHAEMMTVYPHTMTSVSGPHLEITRWLEVLFPCEGVAAVLSGAATVPDLKCVTIVDVTPERHAVKTENISASSRLADYGQATTRYRPSDILELTPAALAVLEKRVADHVAQRNEQDTTIQLLRDAVTKGLSSGWTLKQVIHGRVAPTHLPTADGMEIQIERSGYTADDWKHGRGGEVHVWLMPKDYKPGTPPGGAQVAPAHETITWRAWRVFVWGSGGTDWPTWENDITAALQKAAPTATQAPAEPPPPPAGAAAVPAKGSGSDKPSAAKQASIAGSVESLPAKRPVANARVMIQGTTTNGKSWSLESTTDTEGRFLVESVPPERPVVVVVSKAMEGMGWFQVQAEATLTPGEKRNLGVLRAGVMPPPLATPENTHLMEMNLPATAEGLEKAKKAALKQADRVFRFSNREALALAQPRYTEACASDTDPANGRLAVSRQQQAAAQAEAAHRAAEEARLAAERDQRTAEEHARADELAAAEQAAAKAEYERRAAEQRATTAQPAGDGVAWGAPADGLQAGLTLKTTSRAPRVSAVLVLHLRNASDQPVRILKLASQARYWGACLPLDIRSSGVTLKFQGPNLEPPPLPNESEYITLNPGDADSTEVTFVPDHWNLTVPFDVQAVFWFKQTRSETIAGPFDKSTRQWRTVGGLWTGETRSRAVGISISNDAAKPEATEIQALIERFGNRQPVSPGSNTASGGLPDHACG